MTKYISKNQSSAVANLLTKKLADQINEKKNNLSEIVSQIYLKTRPKEITDAFPKYKNYFQKSSRIRCEGNGLNIEVSLTESVPSTGNWQVCILPSAKESEDILKIYNDVENLETKRNNLKNSIEGTLNSLRTYNRIQKEFPEAFELLPDKEPSINTLAVPIEDIRTQLEALK